MKLLKQYKDIDETLHYLRLQVIDSYSYALKNCPTFSHPRQLFYYLKGKIRYMQDTAGREVLQTMQTLFDKENNVHGVAGGGDCDCFVITLLACCKVNGWNDLYIVLAGRSKDYPVHIWAGIDFEGKYYDMDCTEFVFDKIRSYPYKQKLAI